MFIYTLNTSFGLFYHELLHQCGKTWSSWLCWGVTQTQVGLTAAFSSSIFLGGGFLILLLTISHIFFTVIRSDHPSPRLWDLHLQTKIQHFENRTLINRALALSLVQDWLDIRNAAAVSPFLKPCMRGGCCCTDTSSGPFLVKLSQDLEQTFLDSPLKTVIIRAACAPFPPTLFPSSQFSINMLQYSTLCTVRPSGQLSSQQSCESVLN